MGRRGFRPVSYDWTERSSSRRRGLATLVAVALTCALSPVVAAGAEAPAEAKPRAGTPHSLSESEAVRKARLTGRSVEVTEQRSASQRLLANPDGSMTLEDYVLPQWVERSGDWVPIDTTLARTSGGTLEPKASSVDLAFSGGGDTALVTIAKGGTRLALHWPWKLPAPVVDGDTATYAGAIPGLDGVDLRVRAGSQGFSEQVVVKSREAAADPRLAQVRFATSVQGGALRADGEGDIDLADAAGTSVFHAPAPMMWDSSTGAVASAAARPATTAGTAGEEPAAGAHQAPMNVALSGGDLVVTPDKAMLTAADTQFPVVLDPDWTTSKLGDKGTAWLDVSSSGLHSYNAGEWSEAKVGHYEGWPGSPSSDTYRAFFKYNVSKALHKKIISAEFHAFLDRSFTCTKSAVQLWQSKSFSSSTRWSTKPSLVGGDALDSSTTSGGEPGCDAHDVKLDATKAVTGSTSTVYLALKGGSETSHSYKYFSNVHLTVNFDTYPTVSGLGLSNPKAGCGSSSAPVVVGNSTPSLVATVVDPDPENPHAVFEVWSGTSGGSNVASKTTAGAKSGSQHSMALPAAALADGQTFRWRVTPVDTAYSGTPSGWCYYRVDRTAPESAPTVTTSDLKDSDSGDVNDAIGRSASFTFAPNAATGVTRYQYAWDDDAAAGASGAPSVAAGADGTATVTLTVPYTQDITFRLYVFSYDQANNRSVSPGVFEFTLASADGPIGHWSLDETTGAEFADSAGGHTATLDGGTPGAPGRVGSAATFNGTSEYAETSGPVIHPEHSFTVSAWVKMTHTGAFATAVSQNGPVNSAFYLQYSQADDRWAMSACGVRALSARPPILDTWTHLAGVYDDATRQITLYENGVAQSTTTCAGTWQPGNDGPLAIGRAQFNRVDTDFFPGSIDDVRVYDRVVYGTEPDAIDGSTGGIADLANRPQVQEAYWTGDLGSGTAVADSSGKGRDATLSSATAWTPDGQIDGALELNDATKDHAQTAGPVIRTDGSFTVTAWVRLDKLPSVTATALAQDGTHRSAFYLGYRMFGGSGYWSFTLPAADDDTAGWVHAHSVSPVALDGEWHHLAGVYDAAAQKIRLYVDGDLQAETAFTTPWNAGGPFQLGAARYRSAAADPWPGGIDDVQVFTGVLTADEISEMGS